MGRAVHVVTLADGERLEWVRFDRSSTRQRYAVVNGAFLEVRSDVHPSGRDNPIFDRIEDVYPSHAVRSYRVAYDDANRERG